MQPFHYHAPRTMIEAVNLLAASPGETKVLAGGTDLMVQLRRGTLAPAHVVDLKRIVELGDLEFFPASGLKFGAAVPCADLCEHEAVRQNYPGLVDAFALIGGTATQGRATIGGNVGNAAPSADSIPALIVHRAVCHLAGPKGTRTIPIDAFCTGPGKHVLEPGEFIVSFEVSPPVAASSGAYLRFIPRGEMDIAVAGVAVWLRMEGDSVAEVRMALTSVAPIPLPVPEVAALLVGKKPDAELLKEAGAVAAGAARPISDHRGTADQRRHLVAVLTVRAMEIALERIKAGGQSS